MSNKGFAERAAQVQDKAKEVMEEAGGVLSRARGMFSGDAQFFSAVPSREQLRKALDDASIPTKKDGMKGILAQMCLGTDMSGLFPDVVRNIHVPSIELRKLIYNFIVHYCDERPNEALLSISAFQKDLMDRSVHVRSLALRVLASIRISSIQPVVMLAIKKCMTDTSPLVRRTAAIAAIKAFRISRGDALDQCVEVIAKLLGDKVMDVTGAAAAAWLEICPTRYDLIHREYRRICRALPESSEWAQVPILRMLTRYCRSQFADPQKQIAEKQQARNSKGAAGGGGKNKKNDSDSSDEDSDKDAEAKKKNAKVVEEEPAEESSSEEDEVESFFADKKSKKPTTTSKKATSKKAVPKKAVITASKKSKGGDDDSRASSPDDMDLGRIMDIADDHRLLLQSIKPLLHSANRAVVLHTIALYYHCAPVDMLDQCAKPLLRVLNGPKECALPALVAANSVMAKRLTAFIPYIQDFFPLPTDTLQERELKLRILAKLATRDNLPVLTKELNTHFRVMDIRHTLGAIQGMTLIAFSVPNCSRDILRQLLPLLQHRDSDVVSEVVVALRQVVCLGNDATQTLKTIQQLARGIITKKITTPQARASVLWLVADNLKAHPTITQMAPDMFRFFLTSFKEDPIVVRRQLLFLGQKIYLIMEGDNDLTNRFKTMLNYLLELVRFDVNYDLRDAGNMLSQALDKTGDAFKLLKAADEYTATHKPAPELQDPFGDRSALELTSMSHLVGFSSLKHVELPLWAEVSAPDSLRDPPQQTLSGGSNALFNDDSDSTSSSSSSSDDKASSSSSSSSDSDKDSDDDDAAASKKKPKAAATPAAGKAAVAAPKISVSKPKIQVAIKTISKPTAPAPGKGERILQDFFGNSKKPVAGASTTPPKHADPSVSQEKKDESDEE
jgi:AP-3 complex subunit beta